ncbi:MAG TPA: DUF4249 family protein [Chryseosolibacter sp.]
MKTSIVFIWLTALTGCVDSYEVELPSESARIVIDALVSDVPGETYINIGWSMAVNGTCKNQFGGSVKCEPVTSTGPYKVKGTVTLKENQGQRKVQLPLLMDDKEGMIELKSDFTGNPGNTYDLEVDIEYDGVREFYSSTATMAATPVITDITYEIRNGDVGKDDNFVPLISFTEPNGENFYLFQLCWLEGTRVYCENGRAWTYSIIADTFLPAQVVDLSVDDGASVAKYSEFFPRVAPGSGARVRMFSVDKTTYFFYKALIDQFNNDGGAYSPTPAMPEGNISGGGIGIFRAVQESSADVYY